MSDTCSKHIIELDVEIGDKTCLLQAPYDAATCPYCEIERLENATDYEGISEKLADENVALRAEVERLKGANEGLKLFYKGFEKAYQDEIDNLQAKLSRYEGAVECEGYITSADLSEPNIDIIGIKLSGKAGTFRPITMGERVTVLVFSEQHQ